MDRIDDPLTGNLENEQDTEKIVEAEARSFAYTPQQHRNVRKGLEDIAQMKHMTNQKTADIIESYKKEIAEDMEAKINPIFSQLEELTRKFGITPNWDLYGKAIRKRIDEEHAAFEANKRVIAAEEAKFSGGPEYMPMTSVNFKELKMRAVAVREKDKSLTYKKNELEDTLRVTLIGLENGNIALDDCDRKINEVAGKIQAYRDKKSPDGRAKVLELSAYKSALEADQKTYDKEQHKLREIMRTNEAELDSIDSLCIVQEKAIAKARAVNTKRGIGISALRQYVGNNGYEGLHKLLTITMSNEKPLDAAVNKYDELHSVMNDLSASFGSEAGYDRPFINELKAQQDVSAIDDRQLEERVAKRLGFTA